MAQRVGSRVVLDARAYQAMLDRVALLQALVAGLTDAAHGRVTPHEQVREELLAVLA